MAADQRSSNHWLCIESLVSVVSVLPGQPG